MADDFNNKPAGTLVSGRALRCGLRSWIRDPMPRRDDRLPWPAGATRSALPQDRGSTWHHLPHGRPRRRAWLPLDDPTRESLLEPAVPRPNAGLLLAVCRLLGQTGQKRVRIYRSSQSPAELPVPDEASVCWHGPCDAQMLAMIRAEHHGLVRHESTDPAWLIAEIALAFPQATLAVMVASRETGHELQQRIGRWVRGVAMLDARPNGQARGAGRDRHAVRAGRHEVS